MNGHRIMAGNPKGKDYMKDTISCLKMILKWINMTQIEYKWRALVNTVINLLVP